MAEITFEVEGLPAPQGSHTAISRGGKPALIPAGTSTSRKAFAVWRQAVTDAARDAITGEIDGPLDGPLEVWITFRFPIPASRARSVHDSGWGWKTTKPDIDKLARAACDSLTAAGLIQDDARIVRLHAEKVEVSAWSGAEITVATCKGDWL
jgi:Holliday junction resolvase RusA-like endonuclease